jgi:hypothetical protein
LLVPIASVAASVGAIGLIGSHVSRGARWAVGAAAVLGGAQLVLAVVTDTAAGIWRFWLLNPLFVVVAATAAAWAGRWLIRTTRPIPRLTAVVVLMHVLIAAPARLRALTVQVKSRVFAGPEEALGYLKIPEVTPKGASIFPLSGGDRYAALVGLDRVCRPWDRRWLEIEQELAANPCSVSPGDLVRRLRALDVDYVVVDPSFRRSQFLHCQDPRQFRATVVGLLRVPGTSLVLSVPPPGEPSDTRVVVLEISDLDGPRKLLVAPADSIQQ